MKLNSHTRLIILISIGLFILVINEVTLSLFTSDGEVNNLIKWYLRLIDFYLVLIFITFSGFLKYRKTVNILIFTISVMGCVEFASIMAFRFINGGWPHAKMEKYSQNLFEPHPYLIGTPRPNATLKTPNLDFSHNSHGFRGPEFNMEKRVSVIRILAIGGSTTYGVGVSNKDTWTDNLQNLLGSGYEVINLGAPGYNSAEHIIQSAFLISELNPDLVLYYIGVNDLSNMHVKNLRGDFSNYHGKRQYASFDFPRIWKGPGFSSIYFAVALLQKFDLVVKNPDQKIQIEGEASEDTDNHALNIYKRNISLLINICRAQKIKSMFIPQLLNYDEMHVRQDEVAGWIPYIKPQDMQIQMQRFNQVMAETVQALEAGYLGEVLNSKWPASDFLDYCHFSPQGGKKFANIISTVLKKARAEKIKD